MMRVPPFSFEQMDEQARAAGFESMSTREKIALAPIADRIAETLVGYRIDVTDPHLEEDILEEIRADGAADSWDFKREDILVGMIRDRLRKWHAAGAERLLKAIREQSQ